MQPNQIKIGSQVALQRLAQTMQLEQNAHATPATLAPPLGLKTLQEVEFGVELAPHPHALRMLSLMVPLVAHAFRVTPAMSLGHPESGILPALGPSA